MVTINLYSYTGNRNTINKNLGEPTAIQGTLRADVDVMQPVVKLRSADGINGNYAYIPALKRYYFVDNVVFLGANNYMVTFKVDVLNTYKDTINSATAHVDRSSNGNKFLSNREVTYNAQANISKYEFNGNGKFNENGNIIMVTIKGNK